MFRLKVREQKCYAGEGEETTPTDIINRFFSGVVLFIKMEIVSKTVLLLL